MAKIQEACRQCEIKLYVIGKNQQLRAPYPKETGGTSEHNQLDYSAVTQTLEVGTRQLHLPVTEEIIKNLKTYLGYQRSKR